MKQENEEKWIENLHKRMEDYSEPLPDGLWEELETELNTPKVVPFGVRWRAAAVVLVLLVSSLTVWFLVSPSFNLEEQNRVAEELLAPESEMAESRPDALPEHRLADVQNRGILSRVFRKIFYHFKAYQPFSQPICSFFRLCKICKVIFCERFSKSTLLSTKLPPLSPLSGRI